MCSETISDRKIPVNSNIRQPHPNISHFFSGSSNFSCYGLIVIRGEAVKRRIPREQGFRRNSAPSDENGVDPGWAFAADESLEAPGGGIDGDIDFDEKVETADGKKTAREVQDIGKDR